MAIHVRRIYAGDGDGYRVLVAATLDVDHSGAAVLAKVLRGRR